MFSIDKKLAFGLVVLISVIVLANCQQPNDRAVKLNRD